jgi:D-alanyl-D-alanine carboxypeptidase (penicillin-binding protein 5/6)
LLGKEQAPDGITVIGGKTGTTGEAGYCLVLLSKNEQNQQIISIVFDADARTNLYYLMNEILNLYGE